MEMDVTMTQNGRSLFLHANEVSKRKRWNDGRDGNGSKHSEGQVRMATVSKRDGEKCEPQTVRQ